MATQYQMKQCKEEGAYGLNPLLPRDPNLKKELDLLGAKSLQLCRQKQQKWREFGLRGSSFAPINWSSSPSKTNSKRYEDKGRARSINIQWVVKGRTHFEVLHKDTKEERVFWSSLPNRTRRIERAFVDQVRSLFTSFLEKMRLRVCYIRLESLLRGGGDKNDEAMGAY